MEQVTSEIKGVGCRKLCALCVQKVFVCASRRVAAAELIPWVYAHGTALQRLVSLLTSKDFLCPFVIRIIVPISGGFEARLCVCACGLLLIVCMNSIISDDTRLVFVTRRLFVSHLNLILNVSTKDFALLLLSGAHSWAAWAFGLRPLCWGPQGAAWPKGSRAAGGAAAGRPPCHVTPTRTGAPRWASNTHSCCL